ncbi:D-alanyl-lipoteichoic acid biosynthesis protein DltB [Clostridioides difficile]|nr:D-alanyl-lipoteichoic acid biosynthesis protein DltB [Clostridioides difficile]
MLPVVISKLAGVTRYSSVIGFIGLSYLNFKAIQMIIEIYDGRITEIKFTTFIYFIMFFPTLSSGPIDRWIYLELKHQITLTNLL